MSRPIICAHRGVSAHYPENTLVAIEQACDIGALQTEIDVRKTRDGHIVVMHDEAVDRTTNGTGAVSELTLEEIRALDAGSWKGESHAGERVPTLTEVLELCNSRGMFLCVEIKQYDIAPDVVRLIEEAGAVADCIVISFNFDTVAKVRQCNARIATGFLTASIPPGELDGLLDRVLEHGIPVVSALFTQVTPEVVSHCRLRGITLYAWTLDDVELVREYAAMGVDVIASNRPEEVMAGLKA